MRNLERPGRSPVHATHGMACTSHPLATATAVSILQSGGNAMDAAVAACAVLCVVEPGSTGIGGDCFAIYSPGCGDLIAYNGSGRAPAAATADWYAERGIAAIEGLTPHAVTVPGAVEAWSRLIADHGTKPLSELLAPAIGYARDGYPIHSRVGSDFADAEPLFGWHPDLARVFMPGGRPPREGDIHRQPQLAATLERIAREGRDGFYTGPVAEDIVDTLQGMGGLHTLDDFAATMGDYVTPVRTTYRGYDIHECPPNTHGLTALEMLNILSEFDASRMAPLSAERLHLQIEATRLAYRDRAAYLADPAMAQIPVDALLSAAHARERAGHIRMDRAMGDIPVPDLPPQSNTVYLCVVDRDLNAVSFINSLFSVFGSGIIAPESGVLLQDRGRGFTLDARHPNCIAPGKRPSHTLIPGMARKDGRTVMPFGVMGGLYQPVGHVHFLTNVVDHGLDLQEALDLGRAFVYPDGVVDVETGIPEDTLAGLQALGHRLSRPAKPLGGGQAIFIDHARGVLTGGSDPRKDGCAIGY